MGILFCGLLSLAICTARAIGNPESCMGSEYKDEISVVLWESLFMKMNTILSETSRLAGSHNALSESQKAVSESLRALSENQKALSESQKGLSDSLAELKEKHDVQGRKLAEFMENTKSKLLILEERQLSQTSKSTEFINLAEENFKGIKQSQAEQKSTFSYFTVKYYLHMEWTTILRRKDASVNFYRNWNEYQNGFGKVDGDFFIGLEKLHILTTYGAPQELMIVMENSDNSKRTAKYDLFKIGNEAEKYALLELGEYSGDAGDSLSTHKGAGFSTYDVDNDQFESRNCARENDGAWWFTGCYSSHLTGSYDRLRGIAWNTWNSQLTFAEMKIRSRVIKSYDMN